MTRTTATLAAMTLALFASACSDSGGDGDDAPGTPPATSPGTPPEDGSGDRPDAPVVAPPVGDSPLAVSPDLFTRDGYATLDVVRIDLETVTTPGVCVDGDESGCTLDDVIADTDLNASFAVDIPVHFTATDFPDDGRETNAELRQRGASARQDPRKSFRIELKGQGVRWRGEDRLQLNKHPFDGSQIRNKLAFDLMRDIPNLPSSRTQFANLWIDDGAGPVDYGLFTHVESSDEEFLINRGWDTDGRLYKPERFLFSPEDLASMALDADGEPLDEDAFEARVEIEHGDDHRVLVRAIEALADPDTPFDDVLARHFDEDNLVTWITVNFLLHQVDAITHNFYLYNPAGSETLYFLPWDYDQTFAVEEPPANDDPGGIGFTAEELERRLSYGYAKGAASDLIRRYYRRPGTHDKVLAKATELRNGPLSDATIADTASRYTTLIAPFATRGPDELLYDANASAGFAAAVAASEAALRSAYAVPMPPNLAAPSVEPGQVVVRWSPAVDVTGGDLNYELEVSTSPAFEPGSRVFFDAGIPDAPERVSYAIPRASLPSGRLFVRIVARVATDPVRFWQVSGNREIVDGTTYIGIRAFDVP